MKASKTVASFCNIRWRLKTICDLSRLLNSWCFENGCITLCLRSKGSSLMKTLHICVTLMVNFGNGFNSGTKLFRKSTQMQVYVFVQDDVIDSHRYIQHFTGRVCRFSTFMPSCFTTRPPCEVLMAQMMYKKCPLHRGTFLSTLFT